MKSIYSDRVLAFAGIVQACRCVQQIATTGMAETTALTASIQSILIVDADDCEDIFNAGDKLHTGLKYSVELFSNAGTMERTEVMRMVISVIQLEHTLSKNPAALNEISAGIEKTTEQSEHFSLLHANVLASLAGVYSDTLSVLKIRSLLLAAVRAAVLWRQSGGSRWQLLFYRKRYLHETKQLLKNLN